MPDIAPALPAIMLAAVLISSGIAKLRTPDDLAGWQELGVPKVLRQRWLLGLHPWAEFALALALLTLGQWLGVAAAAVASALMLAYLGMIIRAYRAVPDASCACFGARKPITAATIVRNVWYLALALLAVAASMQLPLWGGAALVALTDDIWIIAALAAVAVTVALSMWSSAPEPDTSIAAAASSAGSGIPVQDADEMLDYIPSHTPALLVRDTNDKEVNLRYLSMTEPMVLLAVKPGCGPCEQALEELPKWRERVPEISIRLLLEHMPPARSAEEPLHVDEPTALYDPQRYVRDSMGGWRTPSAVLLGGNGMLAGGPVVGYPAVKDFIDDIEASLAEARDESTAQERPLSDS